MTPEERKALEELWRERLHATEQRYHQASANYLRIRAEFAGRSMPSPDSNHALQQAIHIENEEPRVHESAPDFHPARPARRSAGG